MHREEFMLRKRKGLIFGFIISLLVVTVIVYLPTASRNSEQQAEAGRAMITPIQEAKRETGPCGTGKSYVKISSEGTRFTSVIVIDGDAYALTAQGYSQVGQMRSITEYDAFFNEVKGVIDQIPEKSAISQSDRMMCNRPKEL